MPDTAIRITSLCVFKLEVAEQGPPEAAAKPLPKVPRLISVGLANGLPTNLATKKECETSIYWILD